ncbi:hypothetical protein, partial [Erwinia amylovora]|uniref:hypothetical protein n=1 Tax=Erwinia amylovora TaxID=552 RepID=UPI00196A7398
KPCSGGVFVFANGTAGRMTVHDAFHKQKAAYRSASHYSEQNPAPAGFLFFRQNVRTNDRPRRFP